MGTSGLCTPREGLSRFDGYTFTNTPRRKAAGATVNDLLETRDRRLLGLATDAGACTVLTRVVRRWGAIAFADEG